MAGLVFRGALFAARSTYALIGWGGVSAVGSAALVAAAPSLLLTAFAHVAPERAASAARLAHRAYTGAWSASQGIVAAAARRLFFG